MSDAVPAKPAGFEDALGDYEVAYTDSSAGVPVAWGFRIVQRLGDDRFDDLKRVAAVECMGYPDNDRTAPAVWYVITRRLTREEAAKLYGPHVEDVYGPRGGWKSAQFGDKVFTAKQFRVAKL